MGTDATLQFGFAAAFVHVRTVTLERRAGAPILDVGEVASADHGDVWVVDRAARDVKIFAPDGRLRHVLRGRSRLADLCSPVSLAPFHGSWMAILDAGVGRVHFYDVRARRQGGFDLPQVEQPVQLRSLADGRLAVVGRGGDGNGRWVHLYRPDGRHAESVFRVPAQRVRERVRAPGAPGTPATDGAAAPATDAVPHSAVAGRSLWLAYGPAASVVLYDFATRLVHSFPLEAGVRPANAASVCGVFAAHGGRVIVMYQTADAEARYAYDLYTAAGEPVLANVRSPQRLVGVEGKLFYSMDAADGDDAWRLRVCRLRDLV